MTAPDRDELRARYLRERDKRLRADGNDQYLELSTLYDGAPLDPYAPAVERPTLHDDVTVAFIGGGFAGLLVGANLAKVGVTDVRIIDKAADFGGTWYWNRYPGAQCDTASMVYLPLLEETGHVPTEKYVHAPEILEHCQRIGRHFDLYRNACLSTEVTSLGWDEAAQRWVIHTDRGDVMRAKYVGMGTGPLHKPKLPGIVGIETFRGHSFHTSRWDYDYTGGNPAGGRLEGLADKRVGLIGTGATAVQCVPHLARSAGSLFVFQRTPSSIDVRNNAPIDPAWFADLQPGWQQRWLENFTMLQTGEFADVDLVMDGWTDIGQRIRDRAIANGDFSPEGFRRAYEDSDDEKMTEIRARVDSVVDDAATAAALKPWYRQLCKRPCFHDDYLQAFNRSNVCLVDTDGAGVEAITPEGVIVAGTHYDLDCIIYGTGFEVGTDFRRRWGFDVSGRGGLLLSDHWADGMRSLHGMHVRGFPNAFVVSPAQGANLISNYPHNFVEAGKTLAAVVAHAEATGATTVEVTEEAEDAWVQLLRSSGRSMGGNAECTPGYYNGEGQVTAETGVINSLGYPDGPMAFFRYIDQWRSSGDFDGLEFSGQPHA